MGIEIRSVTEEEAPAWMHAVANGFGDHIEEDEVLAAFIAETEIDRTVAGFDRGRIISSAGAYSLELTLPGGAIIPFGAVTAVTVLPTHRRQGVLTRMMRHQLDDVRSRGEIVAGLYASESVIYGRFGYGRATESAAIEIDPRYGTFRRPFKDPGRVEMVDVDTASKVLPDVHDRVRRATTGDINRKAVWWEQFMKDRKDDRHGGGKRFYVLHHRGTEVDGYAHYRIKNQWSQGFPGSEIWVGEVTATNPEAEAALWQYILGVDLITKVTGWNFPVDHDLRWRLADSRRLRVTALVDQTWMRLVDVPGALAARRYSVDGDLVLEVNDEFCDWNTGRYLLSGGPDGATCKATKKKADIAIDAVDLGSIFLGGVKPSRLARTGRGQELTKGALERADAMFVTDETPFCRTGY
ncbi:MAG TPA: GNAT family N-acetyltransferase [Acidimicrobiales bacterium]|nr:GNAT family N-acetyltransferase [Acidimicrobiales bacterium]